MKKIIICALLLLTAAPLMAGEDGVEAVHGYPRPSNLVSYAVKSPWGESLDIEVTSGRLATVKDLRLGIAFRRGVSADANEIRIFHNDGEKGKLELEGPLNSPTFKNEDGLVVEDFTVEGKNLKLSFEIGNGSGIKGADY